MDLLSAEEGHSSHEEGVADLAEGAGYNKARNAFLRALAKRSAMRARMTSFQRAQAYFEKRKLRLEQRLRVPTPASQELKAELDVVKGLLLRFGAFCVACDPGIEQAYCNARHRMMMELRALETGNANARSRKMEYLRLAELPEAMDVDDVLYYCHGGKVHLFYGGGLSPTGNGESPDGRGHAHVVLGRAKTGSYKVVYHRRPEE